MYCQQVKDKKSSQIQAELSTADKIAMVLLKMFMYLLSENYRNRKNRPPASGARHLRP